MEKKGSDTPVKRSSLMLNKDLALDYKQNSVDKNHQCPCGDKPKVSGLLSRASMASSELISQEPSKAQLNKRSELDINFK